MIKEGEIQNKLLKLLELTTVPDEGTKQLKCLFKN